LDPYSKLGDCCGKKDKRDIKEQKMIDEKELSVELSALTEDWLTRPYDELLAEATRVGALVGPADHAIQWSPDTCKPHECKLDLVTHGVLIRAINNNGQVREVFVADPSQDVTEGQIHSLCPFHAHLTNPKEHFNVVLRENQLKNTFEATMIITAPDIRESVPRSLQAMVTIWQRTIATINSGQVLDEKVLSTGLTKEEYRKGMEYKWEFDSDRILVVDVTHLPEQSVTAITQLIIEDKFKDKVRIRG
jgi:hypothetical protein